MIWYDKGMLFSYWILQMILIKIHPFLDYAIKSMLIAHVKILELNSLPISW